MRRARALPLLLGLVLVSVGCRADAVDLMARTTLLADQQFAAEYRAAAAACLEASDTRPEYDSCMVPWAAGADAVAALRATTLALDVSGRRAWRSTACRWFEAATVLDATSPAALPAIKAALDSKWSRRC